MLDRRDILRVGMGVAALAGVAHAAEESAGELAAPRTAGDAQERLAKAIGECVLTGNACLEHCLRLLGTGDTSLAECAKSVRDMLPVCGAVQALLAGNSPHTKAAVTLCLDVCTDCERACRKHESHHAICKKCADACASTAKAARTFLA